MPEKKRRMYNEISKVCTEKPLRDPLGFINPTYWSGKRTGLVKPTEGKFRISYMANMEDHLATIKLIASGLYTISYKRDVLERQSLSEVTDGQRLSNL